MLNGLLDQVKQLIFNSPNTSHGPGNDPDGLIGQLEGLFRGHQSQLENQYPNLRPASEDPLGDPADMEYGRQPGYAPAYGNQGFGQPNRAYLEGQYPGIRPASEDPMGDPADFGQAGNAGASLQQQFPGIRPASDDPLGDPADR